MNPTLGIVIATALFVVAVALVYGVLRAPLIDEDDTQP